MLIVKIIKIDGTETIREVKSITLRPDNVPPTVQVVSPGDAVEELYGVGCYFVMNEDGRTVAQWRHPEFA